MYRTDGVHLRGIRGLLHNLEDLAEVCGLERPLTRSLASLLSALHSCLTNPSLCTPW